MKRQLEQVAMALAVSTPLFAVATSANAGTLAAHTTKVPCRAWMSNARPKDYSTVDVWVSTNAHAEVATAAHYRTTTTKHSAWANAKGTAEIAYRISDATPGYKITVAVSVASGRNWGSCSTSFTPYR